MFHKFGSLPARPTARSLWISVWALCAASLAAALTFIAQGSLAEAALTASNAATAAVNLINQISSVTRDQN